MGYVIDYPPGQADLSRIGIFIQIIQVLITKKWLKHKKSPTIFGAPIINLETTLGWSLGFCNIFLDFKCTVRKFSVF